MSARVAQFPRNPDLLPAEKLTDSELSDQYGKADFTYQQCNPRREACRRELVRRTENTPAGEPKLFEGCIWNTTVKPRGFQTKLPSMASIHRMFRAAKQDFYAAVTMTQDAFKAALGEEAFGRLSAKTQTGYRQIDAQLKAQPAKAS